MIGLYVAFRLLGALAVMAALLVAAALVVSVRVGLFVGACIVLLVSWTLRRLGWVE